MRTDKQDLITKLRAIYKSYGYCRFKMSKFEEYDFYARNKDYLISENIVTFTDGGRLMALKPDVTLSIIKNYQGGCSKIFYDESVYRADKNSKEVRELRQLGVEYMGSEDFATRIEMLRLASASLAEISEDYIIEISNLDLISALLPYSRNRSNIIKCINEKNAHDLSALCEESGMTGENIAVLKALVRHSGGISDTIAFLKTVSVPGLSEVISKTEQLLLLLQKESFSEKIVVDFSLVSNMNYYNDLVFRGYIRSVPDAVLSGGCYEKLMNSMGKKCFAVGFAVYTDTIDRLFGESGDTDFDVLLLYDDKTDTALLFGTADELRKTGKTVRISSDLSGSFSQLRDLRGEAL